jgi:hypothetical protein
VPVLVTGTGICDSLSDTLIVTQPFFSSQDDVHFPSFLSSQ